MHSCSITMAVGSHGSAYNGGVRPGQIADRSSCNAMQASLRHERSVRRDLSGQPRSLSWPSQNPLPRTSTLKHCKLPCPYTDRAAFALTTSALHHTAMQQRILQATLAASRLVSDNHTWRVGCTRPSAHASLPLPRAASVIACAARLPQNRCNETHQNKSAPPPRPSVTPKPLRRSQK